MRNVAKRLLLGDALQCVMNWKGKNQEAMNQARGERIFKKVGARFRQADAVEAVGRWRERQVAEKLDEEARLLQEKMQAKGESILGRVGGRFRQMEVASNFGEWRRNCRDGALEMVSETVTYTRAHIHMDD